MAGNASRGGQEGPAGVPGGVWLLRDGLPGLAAPLTPDSLAAAHPLWAFDVRELGPWTPEDRPVALYRAAGGQGHPALVCGPATSALDVAWALAHLLPDHAAVLAVRQEQGRGQLRRPWSSPPGNLYAAWFWPSLERPWDGLASLLAGWCICQALRPRLPELCLKWPNDLLLPDDRGDLKVGGVLVEERQGRMLVGLGLNLVSAPHAADLRQGAAVEAGFLNMLCQGRGPLGLWLELAHGAQRGLRTALRGTPQAFLARLEAMLAWRGRQVRVRDGGGSEIVGVLAGLANDGGLRLATDSGEEILYGGSIYPLY